MTTSFVLALAGALLILVGLIGGGFSFSGSMMPVVGKAIRIPCFIVGIVLVFYAIFLALAENKVFTSTTDSGGSDQSAVSPGAPSPKQATVQVAGGGIAYIYQLPSLVASPVGALTNGATVTILCTVQGDTGDTV
jgi:hypothetical protein